jgi:CheY-like chemotaxis protein
MDLIDRQVMAFTRLIDDLMDVSRINQGRIELRREVVALNDVLADALETVRPHLEAAGHDVAVLLPDRSLAVEADRTRLAQAFVNLLHNAVKYTDAGGRIEVGVVVEHGQAVVTVRDSGIGISPEHLEKVFEMFSQVESALSRSRGGLGIGLSLTQRLVQMHGGTVKAYSDGLGRGSRFHVQLPLVDGLPQAAAQPQAQRLARQPLRILVADDNQDAALTLGALLEMLGHQVRIAHDGEAAVAAAPEFDPQLVVLDIGMPKLNGYQACKRLRQQAGGAGRTIVALTGWGQQQDIVRSQEAGFDRHLVKPVDVQALTTIIAEVAADGPKQRASGNGH